MNDKIKNIYTLVDKSFDLVRSSPDSWKSYLAFYSGIYKYDFTNSLLIYAQRPDATACASLEIWNKLGRRIKAGSKGIQNVDEKNSSSKNLMHFLNRKKS